MLCYVAACMFVGAALSATPDKERQASSCVYVCDKQHTYILHTTNYKQHTADRNPTLACACMTQVQHFIRNLSSRLDSTRVEVVPPDHQGEPDTPALQCAFSNLTFIHSDDDQSRAPRDLWTKFYFVDKYKIADL